MKLSKKLLKQMATRDERDYKHAIAPLIKAHDAILIDSSHKSIGEIIEQMEKLLKARV